MTTTHDLTGQGDESRADLEGKTVTITGGTRSFGGVMARALLDGGAARVNIFSRDEAEQDETRRRVNDERMRPGRRVEKGVLHEMDRLARGRRTVNFIFSTHRRNESWSGVRVKATGIS